LGDGGDLKNWQSGRRHHGQATAKLQDTNPTPILEVDRGAPSDDSAPNLKTQRTPTLLAIQRGQPPLSQSLRPARPSEEEGAGETATILKVEGSRRG
jgi:hypothetical protein